MSNKKKPVVQEVQAPAIDPVLESTPVDPMQQILQ